MKVARGRSWQPEIGMEHASRGRRSGNKGVGARWRGRFRIFSARHCSRTKVSHAENSGMTMVFFSWRLLRCRREWEREHEGGLIRCAGRPQEWSFGAVPPQERWHEEGWFLFFLGGCSGVGGGFFHTLRSGCTRGWGSGLRAASGEDGTPPCGGAGEGVRGATRRVLMRFICTTSKSRFR